MRDSYCGWLMRLGPPSSPGMTESTFAPPAILEPIGLDDLHANDGSENDLRDTIARLDGQGLAAQVNQDNPKLAAIVGVDCSGRIHQRQTFAEGAATARTHLTLVAARDFNCDSGGDGGALQRLQNLIVIDIRHQIDPGCMIAMVARQRQRIGTKTLNFYLGHRSQNQSRQIRRITSGAKRVTIIGYSKLEFNYAAQPGPLSSISEIPLLILGEGKLA
jgi:hypothetical protein